jgi:predicted RecB family endonuclease
VGTINNAVQVLSSKGEDQQAFAEAIKQLTEAVVSDARLKDDQKHEAVEALSTLADEAEHGRRGVTGKALVTWLPSVLGLSADLITLWDKFGPAIRAYFGL